MSRNLPNPSYLESRVGPPAAYDFNICLGCVVGRILMHDCTFLVSFLMSEVRTSCVLLTLAYNYMVCSCLHYVTC